MTTPGTRPARLAFLTFLAVYGALSLRAPGTWRLLDGVDLAIHETGHLVFAPFGEFAAVFGGTLFQLVVPAAFVVAFLRRGDRFAASACVWWIAQNLWNVSVYIADARAQELPLVGGGEHDWATMLGDAGWLAHDLAIARVVHLAGVMVYLAALGTALIAALAPDATDGHADPGVGGDRLVADRIPPVSPAADEPTDVDDVPRAPATGGARA